MATLVFPKVTRTLQANLLAAPQWVPMTDWAPAISVKSLQWLIQLENTSNFTVTGAYQVATLRKRDPGTVTTSGSATSTDGKTITNVGSIAGTGAGQTDDDMWIRFGVEVAVITAGYGQSEVSISVSCTDQ